MSEDLERRLRDAVPDWPAPSEHASARARAALRLDDDTSRGAGRAWWARLRRARGGRLLLAGAVLVVGGAVATAAIITVGSGGDATGEPASLAFGPAEEVGGPVDGADGAPSVAVDGAGRVTVVWGRMGRIVVRTRAVDGTWAPERLLSPPGQRAADPALAMNRAGRAAVVWRQRTSSRTVRERFTLPSGAPAGLLEGVVDRRWTVVAAVRDGDGAWSSATGVSDEVTSGRDMDAPAVAVSDAGEVLVAWDQANSARVARRPALATEWEPPMVVGSARGEAVRPVLRMSPSGQALMAWMHRDGDLGVLGTGYSVRSALRTADGSWGPVVELAAGQPANVLLAADVDDEGRAVVVWTRGGDTMLAPDSAWSARTSPDGEWETAEPVVTSPLPGGYHLGAPVVVLEGDGAAVAHVHAAAPSLLRAPDGGRWRPLEDGPSADATVRLVRDGAGGTVIAASRPTSPPVVRRRDSPGVAIPEARGIAGLSAGSDGTTAVVWVDATEGSPRDRRVVVSVAPGQR